MKSDTSHFCTLEIAKYFSFCDRYRSDPFLITAGLAQQPKAIAQGSGITAMYAIFRTYFASTKPANSLDYRKQRQQRPSIADKVIVPLTDAVINQAKVWYVDSLSFYLVRK